MPTVRLTIDGMMCDGCATRVEENLRETPGVESAAADETDGTAKVRVTAGESDADELRNSVEELGYEVTGLQGV